MKKTIIYFLYKNKDIAEKLFYELIFPAQYANEIATVFFSWHGNRAIFKNGDRIEMYPGHRGNVRGLWWTTAYIDCDIDKDIIQNIIIPSGKGSKDIIYFN